MSKKIDITKVSLSPPIIIIGAIIIAFIGISQAALYPPATPISQTNLDYGNWQRVTNARAIFTSKVFLDRSNTFIVVPIKFDDTTKISWISLDSTSSTSPSTLLMTHPQLENLNWPTIKKDLVTLYQRNKNYESIDAFIANPPAKDQTAIEDGIKKLPAYADIPGYPLDNTFSTDNVDYILTTFTNPPIENGAYYYSNTIDASEAIANSNNNLGWRITVPEASSESAYYLGQIHVDYR